MAQYVTPTVYYQTSINANTAVEVVCFKSLSWGNRTNNSGNFELIVPKYPTPGGVAHFTPSLGGYIRLDPGDTIMKIEKKYTISDAKGLLWYKLSGRPRQADDEVTRDAQNKGYFFRYKYNGVSSEQYVKIVTGTPITTINKQDILESEKYEDNLGGNPEQEMIDPGKPEQEAFSWSSTVVSQPEPLVTEIDVKGIATCSVPTVDFDGFFDGGTYTYNDIVSIKTDSVFMTDDTVSVTAGKKSGRNGRDDIKTSSRQWFKNDVETDVEVFGTVHQWGGKVPGSGSHPTQITGSSRGSVILRKRKVTKRDASEMESLMTGELSPGSEPAVPAVPPTFRISAVGGGHLGYSCVLKSKGEVEKRYKVDFNLGETIAVNDTRLDVVYTGVVSGAIETIDSTGYRVDIEIGTLGATLEQRVQRVI